MAEQSALRGIFVCDCLARLLNVNGEYSPLITEFPPQHATWSSMRTARHMRKLHISSSGLVNALRAVEQKPGEHTLAFTVPVPTKLTGTYRLTVYITLFGLFPSVGYSTALLDPTLHAILYVNPASRSAKQNLDRTQEAHMVVLSGSRFTTDQSSLVSCTSSIPMPEVTEITCLSRDTEVFMLQWLRWPARRLNAVTVIVR